MDSPDAISQARCLDGNLYLQEGNLKMALKVFQRAYELDRADSYAALSFAKCSYDLSKSPALKKEQRHELRSNAFSLYKEILKKDKDNFVAARGVAVCLAEKMALQEARDAFIIIKEHRPNDPESLINLAHVYMMLGQFGSAQKLYEGCADRLLGPHNNSLCLQYLARAYFEDGCVIPLFCFAFCSQKMAFP